MPPRTANTADLLRWLPILLSMVVAPAGVATAAEPLPAGFVDLADAAPDIACDVKYAGGDNFVGRSLRGYESNRCLMTRPAAAALKRVQDELRPFGLGLLVFDAYRPQRAVDDFVAWARDAADNRMKSKFYPEIAKTDLFAHGYVAKQSGHSRGSTVDVTIVDLRSSEDARGARPLDMGTGFDFFGPESWHSHLSLAPHHRAQRMLLRTLMEKHGFRAYDREWWHYTLRAEPFPNTYFDFPIR